MNISSLICDCIKTSSKYVIAFFLSMNGQKILLIKAENDAGPMEMPKNNLLIHIVHFR